MAPDLAAAANLGRHMRYGLILIPLTTLASAASSQMPASWTEPFEPVQIADNMYYVGSAGLSAFLLTSTEGHVLIDAPLAENVPLVLDNIRALGFDPGDIRLHLTTHAHFDHVGGLPGLMAVTGGQLGVSDGDRPFIESGTDFGLETEGYPAAVVSRWVAHLDMITLGDIELTAHLTPGHTPGCTSWSGTVTVEGSRYTFLLVCSLSPLRNYRLGGDDPTYHGQAEDFCRSLSYLGTKKPDFFLSNHGSFFGLAEKAAARRAGDKLAFIRAQEFSTFLEAAAVAINRELSRQGLVGCEPPD